MSDANANGTTPALGASPRVRTVTIPPQVVPHFEAALRHEGIAAGVNYHDDGSRTYHVDSAAWDETAVIRAAERAVDDLRKTLQNTAA